MRIKLLFLLLKINDLIICFACFWDNRLKIWTF